LLQKFRVKEKKGVKCGIIRPEVGHNDGSKVEVEV
jgi:hypothetical protein